MNKQRLTKALVAIVVVGGASGYLLFQAFRSSLAYYYSVDEFVARQSEQTPGNGGSQPHAKNANHLIRLAGRVKEGSIAKDPNSMQLDFELAGREHMVPVRFHGVVPQNFQQGREVVVEGRLFEGVFAAEKILTRCESKYKVKLNAGSNSQ
jgi:cytochrome c-type biogenesis protein CcmE